MMLNIRAPLCSSLHSFSLPPIESEKSSSSSLASKLFPCPTFASEEVELASSFSHLSNDTLSLLPFSFQPTSPSTMDLQIQKVATGHLIGKMQRPPLPKGISQEVIDALINRICNDQQSINRDYVKYVCGNNKKHKLYQLTPENNRDLSQAFPPGSITSILRLQKYTLLKFHKVVPRESIIDCWARNRKICVITADRYFPVEELEDIREQFNLHENPHSPQMLKLKIERYCHQAKRRSLSTEDLRYLREVVTNYKTPLNTSTVNTLLRAIRQVSQDPKTTKAVLEQQGLPIRKNLNRMAAMQQQVILEEISKLEQQSCISLDLT